MNKAELIDAITDTVGDKRTATAAVEAVLATVQRTVAAGDKVSVPGFGVFEKVDRAARTARNPATGEAVQLEATSVPRFRPGTRFKDVVRGAAEAPELPAPAAASTGRTSRAGTAPATPVAEPDDVPGVADEAPPVQAAPSPGAAAVPSAAPTAPAEGGGKAAKGGKEKAAPKGGKEKAAPKGGKEKAAPKGKEKDAAKGKGKDAGKGKGKKK